MLHLDVASSVWRHGSQPARDDATLAGSLNIIYQGYSNSHMQASNEADGQDRHLSLSQSTNHRRVDGSGYLHLHRHLHHQYETRAAKLGLSSGSAYERW